MEMPEGTMYATIPLQVFLHPDLTDSEKRLFWKISVLDCTSRHCYASNEYLSENTGLNVDTIRKGIAKLEELGFLQRWFEDPKDSKSRVLKIDLSFFEKYANVVYGYHGKGGKAIPGGTGKAIPGDRESHPTEYKEYNKKSIEDNSSNEELGDRGSPFDSYSQEAEDLFNYWKNLGSPLPQIKNFKSKSFTKAMDGITSALSRTSNDVELIRKSIDDYHELLCQIDNTILNAKVKSHVVGINEFFRFDDYTKGSIIASSPIYGIKSWFDECCQGFDYLMDMYGKDMEEDRYPNITDKILAIWENSDYCVGKVSIKDISNFRVCSSKMVKWFRDNQDDYSYDLLYVRSPIMAVQKYLFPALKHSLKGNDPREVSSGWLATDRMFSHRLHLYFVKLGMYHGGNRSGISSGGDEE